MLFQKFPDSLFLFGRLVRHNLTASPFGLLPYQAKLNKTHIRDQAISKKFISWIVSSCNDETIHTNVANGFFLSFFFSFLTQHTHLKHSLSYSPHFREPDEIFMYLTGKYLLILIKVGRKNSPFSEIVVALARFGPYKVSVAMPIE